MSQIVIATSTRYPNPSDVRARLALEMFQTACEHGYTVLASDGGSDPSWVAEAAAMGIILLPEREGDTMGAGRREAMRRAAVLAGPNGIVAWMEPEKIDFVRFIETTAKPIRDGRAKLVIPTRKSLDSYPPEQVKAELKGNQAVKTLLGGAFDFWFGVMLWSVSEISHVLDYDGTYGDRWDSIMVPRLRAMAAGVSVVSVTVGYIHPAAQTAQETGNSEFDRKRLEQLANIVPALEQEVDHLGIRGLYTNINVAV